MRRFVLLILILSPMGDISGQTFGLGGDEPAEVAAVAWSEETFGLGDYHAASAALVKASRATNAARSAEKLDSKPSDTLAVVVADPQVVLRSSAVVTATAPYSSPPGYHRHVMVDGTVLEHHNSNYGDPVAHAGVAGRNWPKYYGPQAPTIVNRGVNVSTCPGGVCPTNAPVRRGLFFRR